MPQAVWTGTLSFGLVSIPVKLYGATSPRDVRFHHFEGRTRRRVRYRRVADESDTPLWEGRAAGWPDMRGAEAAEPASRDDAATIEAAAIGDSPAAPAPVAAPEATAPGEPEPDREVAFEDVVRGFEVDPGRFVRVTSEELEELAPEPSRSIDIEDFVDLADIDPVYFEKSYHVVPGPGSERQYRLLVRAMEQSGRVAIGRFVLRTREHVAAIRPSGGGLMLETLFHADEIRQRVPDARPAEEPSDRELAMAVRLIETLGRDWDPARYPDAYRERVLEMIQAKAGPAPERPPLTPASEDEPAVFDLMKALERSVEEARRARAETPPAPHPRRRRSG